MSSILSNETVVARASDHLSAVIGDQTVLMSVQDGKYVGLDPIGSAIWSRIDKPVSVEALCADLLASFEATPEALKRDVLAFLKEMQSLGMIEFLP